MFYLFLTVTEGSTLFSTLYENKIFILGILILFALVGGKLIERLNFPKVTGYIVMGVIIGPSLSSLIFNEQTILWMSEHVGVEFDGLISTYMVHTFQIIRQVAIGFIGYTIGLELRFKKLRKTGKQVTVITLVQALTTAILVCLAVISYLSIAGESHVVTFGLILGAIATATAPAPIVAVVKNYRTKGPVTDILLPLVALDDAIGIMLFAIMLSLGTTLLGVGGTLTSFEIIFQPLKEIFLSLVIGGFIGVILSFVVKRLNRENDNMLLMIIISAVFVGIGIGQVVHASAILLPMTIGVVLTNSIDESFEHRLTRTTDLFIAPIMLAFFMIAGLELDLTTIPVVLGLGGVYIIVRITGKISGAFTSSKLVKAPRTVTKYLGFTLIPQAGVAIDMAITANARFEEIPGFEYIGLEIMTIVLAATVIYEVFGLIVVKTALHKAGEIDAGDVGWNPSH